MARSILSRKRDLNVKGRSILFRKRDLLYLIFFCIHLPVMFLVDLTPLYPESMKPVFMMSLRKYYIDTYQDQFFIAPPAWFRMYMWMELLYHAPLCVWAIGALMRNDPKIPLQLLLYACQTGMTTITCIADYLSWKSFSSNQKLRLGALYVPYLALSVFMGVDMLGRLNERLNEHSAKSKKSGKKA
ncbi:uncharacterized protein K452DRAFT_256741 [Aplosporella prunicola CBS 121167]|uniref:Efficient mitochondria targeting-associated protein 19 n=1 Tax=Aplosporella prunicola CBS 121167 TaxID=1176127 RepID=A0A6A6B1B2_9PEZI|nr:uncharacterized protein K452DRAFT_256741 [Aplosporella prunicola CBS 121167]KAF2137992.1 hypothetical protein K452DRAFT_256741 [Aplosporella prunicola CBS 121167]